ncbi:MAG: metallophosphoesterase, partial [Acidimicrobiales bacterium]|nr:metallophosphoesterase [Acidimicrobiales bacterium]
MTAQAAHPPAVGAEAPDRRRSLKLLHLSDSHLRFDPGGEAETAFERALRLADDPGIEVVLFTGDLFDHGRVAEEHLVWVAACLSRLDKPVVMLPGNHDLSAWPRFDPARRCPNVHLISAQEGQTVRLDEVGVVIWARAMEEHEPDFRPLQGLPAVDPDMWCIAAAHGLVVDEEGSSRASPITPGDLSQ